MLEVELGTTPDLHRPNLSDVGAELQLQVEQGRERPVCMEVQSCRCSRDGMEDIITDHLREVW